MREGEREREKGERGGEENSRSFPAASTWAKTINSGQKNNYRFSLTTKSFPLNFFIGVSAHTIALEQRPLKFD